MSSQFGSSGLFGEFLFGAGSGEAVGVLGRASLVAVPMGASSLDEIPIGDTDKVIIKRGDGRDITCVVTNLDGSSYDLSTCTVWFGAKSQHYLADNSAEIFKISTTAGHMTITGNQITVHIKATDTSGLPSRAVRLYYEFQVKPSGAEPFTVDSGSITVEPDVVRATS